MRHIIYLLLTVSFVFSLDEALIKKVKREWEPQESENLIKILEKTESQKLPLSPLEDKVWEGLAKKVSADRIIKAVKKRKNHLKKIFKTKQKITPFEYKRLLYLTEKNETPVIKPVTPSSPGKKHKKTKITSFHYRNKDNTGKKLKFPAKGIPAPLESPIKKDKMTKKEKLLEKRQKSLEKRTKKQEKMLNKLEKQRRMMERKSKK